MLLAFKHPCYLFPATLSRMFSWQGFVPLSKLSYCAFLVHFFPQFLWVSASRTPVYMSFLETVSIDILSPTTSVHVKKL